MFVCAGNGESFSFATAIGVGLVESSINLTRAILLNPPEFIIFLGSAGSYGSREIFEIVESKSASNIEHSLLQGNSYTPIDNIVSTATDLKRDLIVNSSNYITKSREISNLYLKKGIELENMEFFAVMSAAREFNIPAGGAFVVTNYCFKDAHREFLANQKEGIALLEKHIREKFSSFFKESK